MGTNRVVVTGLGVCAPNAVSVPDFKEAIADGKSGVRFFSELRDLKFSCQIGAMPLIPQRKIDDYFTPLQLRNFNSAGILYGVIAGMDAWKDAGLKTEHEIPDFDSGTVFGMGTLGVDKYRESIYKVDDGNVRRLGSTSVQQTMSSGVSAYLGGMLGLGNLVTSNSSACATGTEAILTAYERIKYGKAKRMLAGSTSDGGPYVWCGFDALRILPSKYNKDPKAASRPMDSNASGFVPGCGAGALVLESLDSALARNATIYAEILGGHSNSGGQRQGGSMTAPNSEAVVNCIKGAVADAKIAPQQIDAINGHLTATTMDAQEIKNWSSALGLKGMDFPYINSLKGMVGHCLAASGSIECVASVLQLKNDFLFPNINITEVHPEILEEVDISKIPLNKINIPLQTLIKASFGFGDVNCCLIFSIYKPNL
ncbi:beta-ketoacyl-[acyl-carrier-protein] synthase family protein [Flavimarina sp. Hel_I_48]|uniref:beta-ketoacyl-[acyl-carrier-protein] synthase family protein n=1 Tax=Flavimarina sp. Hel_I_48 TaxID=1392488 RepID=UPI0004DFB9DF|nr:beta-ketoacyl-[acyl-carrier-protein] synthase family protein [Flavimarina sp. Hel_I_48]